jgi:hypothetical protein
VNAAPRPDLSRISLRHIPATARAARNAKKDSRIEIGDQVGAIRSFEARPGPPLPFHRCEHASAVPRHRGCQRDGRKQLRGLAQLGPAGFIPSVIVTAGTAFRLVHLTAPHHIAGFKEIGLRKEKSDQGAFHQYRVSAETRRGSCAWFRHGSTWRQCSRSRFWAPDAGAGRSDCRRWIRTSGTIHTTVRKRLSPVRVHRGRGSRRGPTGNAAEVRHQTSFAPRPRSTNEAPTLSTSSFTAVRVS